MKMQHHLTTAHSLWTGMNSDTNEKWRSKSFGESKETNMMRANAIHDLRTPVAVDFTKVIANHAFGTPAAAVQPTPCSNRARISCPVTQCDTSVEGRGSWLFVSRMRPDAPEGNSVSHMKGVSGVEYEKVEQRHANYRLYKVSVLVLNGIISKIYINLITGTMVCL